VIKTHPDFGCPRFRVSGKTGQFVPVITVMAAFFAPACVIFSSLLRLIEKMMSMSNRTKQEIENDFIRMIRENERVVYKVCSVYASDVSPIEDLYQEAVLNLWKAFPRFRNESRISTWIYRITLNSCISDLRQNAKHKYNVPLSLSVDVALEPDTMEEDLRELYRMIRLLKNIERAIILLWLEEKSYQEIADITGLTVTNVAVRLKRIKEKLKTMSNQ
jgi:RNA polymerase sigma-70 factor (ECF subfamily)